jgi:hypothetical protein
MCANYSEIEITSEMERAGVTPELIVQVVDELAKWESSGELYEEFARRLLALIWKNLKK